MAETITLQVSGMHCASCVGRAEKALLKQPGVVSASVNLANATAFVASRIGNGEHLALALSEAGYPAEVQADPFAATSGSSEAQKLWRRFALAFCLTLPVFVVEMGGHLFPAFHHFVAHHIDQGVLWGLQLVLISLVLLFPGWMFFTNGFSSLLRRAPDMNSLVALGSGSAWVFSTLVTLFPELVPQENRVVYFEAAGVIVTLILLGRALEARAKSRAGAAVQELIGLQPDTAMVRSDAGWITCDIHDVVPDVVLLARPGDRIAVDGRVVSGTGFVDEAMLNGEPLPNQKQPCDPVFAGTVNGTAALEYRATGVGAETYLARIVAMVAQAQAAKLPVQAKIDRVTGVFVPVVMGLAMLTVMGWLVFGGTLTQALVAGVSVLIIACPCAMGLATPVSVVVATGRAAQIGALLRNGHVLETLATTHTVAFDKTGTLTLGAPTVTAAYFPDATVSLEDVAAVEALSEHPLAAAIVEAAKSPLPTATGFEATPGQGATAEVNKRQITIGSDAFMESLGINRTAFAELEDDLLKAGSTPVFVACNGLLAGLIGISDPVRDEARSTLQGISAQGIHTSLISGDRTEVARRIGDTLGIESVHGDVRPEEKQSIVAQMRANGTAVFVGDGINDSPALAEADIGIAMGQGTVVAIETADVVLMPGRFSSLPDVLTLSRATMRNIRQNLFWAFAYNVALVPVAMGVFYPFFGWQLSPMLAAGAMALSSVFVVANALRLRTAV